jgi:uncharacterized damage-inducible protein DinB
MGVLDKARERFFRPQARPARPSAASYNDLMNILFLHGWQSVPPELDQPVPHPHPFATTKLKALLWCAHHEMLHAGQIGLLRHHLGYPPMW